MDRDAEAGHGHPLPASAEARRREIPEHLVREKGEGDDKRRRLQPEGDPVTPDGEAYAYGDLGRGGDDLARDQAAHQDRGQSVAQEESDRE